jgi:hypothetical protein
VPIVQSAGRAPITFDSSLLYLSRPEGRHHNFKVVNRTIRVAALVAMSLLALPFGGLGIALLVKSMERLAEGRPHAIRSVIVGGFFTLTSILLMVAIVRGARKLQRTEQLQAEHPADPWLWREDWASGQVNGTSGSSLLGLWIRATLFNAISWITVIFLPWQQYRREPVTLIGCVFPLLGINALVWAVRKTLARRQFGKTFLELATLPAPLGRELRGAIHARFPQGLEGNVGSR